MSAPVAELRGLLGSSCTLWAGPDGVTRLAHGWTAFSGARSVDYNVALCTGDGDALEATVERVLAERVPSVVMVAGAALGEVQRLVARSWVCVGATPLMVAALDELGPAIEGVATRVLESDSDLAAARALVADVFEIDAALATIALPEPSPSHRLWGAFDESGELRSCLALSFVQETAVVWSMATDARMQGRGYGRAALLAGCAQAGESGARRALLYASPAGEPFYRRLGFAELERWQIWSRPRWVLGRA